MPASRPLPTRIEEAACAMESRKDFCASPMVTATETAMHGKGNALGWFQDEGISARDSIRKEPVRDHRGEIEGYDGGDNSEGLADLHFIHARSYILEVVALHHHGDAAGNFDVFDGAAQFGAGFGEGLAIFQSDH